MFFALVPNTMGTYLFRISIIGMKAIVAITAAAKTRVVSVRKLQSSLLIAFNIG